MANNTSGYMDVGPATGGGAAQADDFTVLPGAHLNPADRAMENPLYDTAGAASGQAAVAKVCQQCGVMNEAGETFCKVCGVVFDQGAVGGATVAVAADAPPAYAAIGPGATGGKGKQQSVDTFLAQPASDLSHDRAPEQPDDGSLRINIRRGALTQIWGLQMVPAANQAILIANVVYGSAAEMCGVCTNDVLQALDGVPVQALQGMITSTLSSNQTLVTQVTVRPASFSAGLPPTGETPTRADGTNDVQLIKKKPKYKWGFCPSVTSTGGFHVGSFAPGPLPKNIAYQCGLRLGDQIVKVNGMDVNALPTLQDLSQQLIAGGCAVAITIKRRHVWMTQLGQAQNCAPAYTEAAPYNPEEHIYEGDLGFGGDVDPSLYANADINL